MLPKTTLRRAGDKVELVLPPALADLRGARLDSRMRQFAALGGLGFAVVVEE